MDFVGSARSSRSEEVAAPPPRWRTWLRRCLLALAAILLALVALVVALLHSLDAAWLKKRLRATIRSAAGVDVDYGHAVVNLTSGLTIEQLVVAAPAEVRAFGPELARVGRLNARWSVGSLLGRSGPRIPAIAIDDVALTVAVDENGRTSFDALSTGPPPPPSPATPLSHLPASILGSVLPIGRVDVTGVKVAVVRTQAGAVAERLELAGLAAAVTTSSAEPKEHGAAVGLKLGEQAKPLDLVASRTPAAGTGASAHAQAWIAVDATPSAAHATLDLRMVEQSFVPTFAASRWLHAEASAHFDAAAAKTDVSLDSLAAGDGAATATARTTLPDQGDVLVRSAHASVDGARLLGWLPAGLVPVRAKQASLVADVDSLDVGTGTRLTDGGSGTVKIDLAEVAMPEGAAPVTVDHADVSLRAEPTRDGGLAAKGTIRLGAVRVGGGAPVAADGIDVDVDATQAKDGALSGTVTTHFARVAGTGASPFEARGGRITLGARALRVDAGNPLASKGDVDVAIDLATAEAHAGSTITAEGLKAHLHTSLTGAAPYGLDVDAPVTRLRVADAVGKPLVDAPVHLILHAHDVSPNLVRAVASRGVLHAELELGDVTSSFDVTKAEGAADYQVHVAAKTLQFLAPMLPPSVAGKAPLGRMALDASSSGRVEHLGEGFPAVTEKTVVALDQPACGDVSARSVALSLATRGTAAHPRVDVDLAAKGLALPGSAPSDDHLAAWVDVDRGARALEFDLATEGRAKTKLAGKVSFDSARRAIMYAVDGHLGGLAPLAPFAAKVRGLDAFDLRELDVGLSTRGTVLGVVDGVSADGALALAPAPAKTALVQGTTDLTVAHFHWTKGDTAVIAPSLALHLETGGTAERRTVSSRLAVGTVHLDLGENDIDLNGIEDEARLAVSGDVASPNLQVNHDLSVKAVTQDLVPAYPLGDLSIALEAERSPEGMVHLTDLKIGNGAGGTTLDVNGNLYLGEGRQSASLTTALTQDLGHLAAIPERFVGKGKLAVDANVASPDLTHFTVHASMKGDDVSLRMPRNGIEVDGANGDVPITVAVVMRDHRVVLERSDKRSPYSMLRFADQHPLLARSGFVSIQRLKTPFAEVSPLVGNLAIEQNVFSLQQFELGVRGGRITGQCGVDWEGAKSSVELHVRATGVQSSHGEPFDGNIAVAISAADRTVEGRAEILRIGERHLLDLLDLQDPSHVDPAMNRIRTALTFGYPEHLRLVFDHGFASAHLDLGGLASLISIGELRGIPMGPIVDKALAPFLDGLETKDDPKETP